MTLLFSSDQAEWAFTVLFTIFVVGQVSGRFFASGVVAGEVMVASYLVALPPSLCGVIVARDRVWAIEIAS